jgi:hypothetical protein
MADGEGGGELVRPGDGRTPRKRGPYTVGPRLRIAIEAMATGQAKTITEAAAAANLTREALSKALRRESVRGYMRSVIMETLGVGAVRAGRKVLELLEDAENSMVQLGAAKLLLGVGAGVVMPSPPGVAVQVNVAPAGYCIDLSENDGSGARVVGPSSASACGPVTIEGTAEEVS